MPEDSVFVGVDLQHLRTGGEHSDDGARLRRNLSWCRRASGTCTLQVGHCCLVDVTHDDFVAVLQQVLGHRRAHVAQTDEAHWRRTCGYSTACFFSFSTCEVLVLKDKK